MCNKFPSSLWLSPNQLRSDIARECITISFSRDSRRQSDRHSHSFASQMLRSRILARAMTGSWVTRPALPSSPQPCRQLCTHSMISRTAITTPRRTTASSRTTLYQQQQQRGYAAMHQASRTQSGRRRWGPVTIGLALCPFITFGLGTWQVQRLRWKVARCALSVG